MPSRTLTVDVAAHDPARLARFWADLLDRSVVAEAGGLLLPGGDGQVGLRFVAGEPGPVPHYLHLHLTSDSAADQEQRVATALRLGGRHLDVGQRPEEGHIVLADPAGYEFCVIEPGNSYLAGCGPLGELACDGTRGVGLFWGAALDWPLVWDRDEETAVQSPQGGTKVAWGGPPVHPRAGRGPQRFELVCAGADQRAEVERLVALGATRLDDDPDGAAVLADPDGTEFRVRAG
ncbi:VOC family protein [Micromonospora auratinigra]|uniref:Glyoxalase-like domain-containing protein n=1 Tax=Micromonospora auratinigra TaxID=261654 RepID=A0A1A8Z5I2_9ACTN|nr:VOC family protein [Micromonospora auratinigra]SBT39195.1 Glyoxalase-like domain-containing protein [Micromonospora auratinigra]